MLRIRKGIKFSKLKKYGFERDYAIDEWTWVKRKQIGLTYEEYIYVWERDGELQVKAIDLLETLYDLIKDGILEKVEK